jgi:NAD(P)-dependent dehydrogenase (short-subunit alcohol dehydrogenase family)
VSGADRVAIVTGSASGIGRATAVRLSRDGYRLVLVDVDGAGLDVTLGSVRAGDGRAQAFTVDVTDPLELGELTRVVTTRTGVPSLLVNVAGVGVAATVPETSDAEWERVIGINLTGPFLLTRAVLPSMLDQGRGVVINVASTAALVGIRARAAYCASKAGLLGLTRAIAADHGDQGIRCVAICPGTVETEWIGKILASAPDPVAARARMAERQLDGRLGTPDEIAATIAFVASDEGRFFNGSAVVVDGGMTAV